MSRQLGQPFVDTLVALDHEQRRYRARTLIGIALVAFAAWALWGAFAEVDLFVTSRSARIERREVLPLVATASGRLVSTKLQLGTTVHANDVVAELDTEVEQQQLAEAVQRASAFAPRLDAARAELAAERTRLEQETESAQSAVAYASAKLAEATEAERFALGEAARMGRPAADLPANDRLRLNSIARQRRGQRQAAEAELRRVETDRLSRAAASNAHLERLGQEIAELEGSQRSSAATIDVAKERIARRRIVAPADGDVASTNGLQPGSDVREGDRLATLLPTTGPLRIVSEFAAQDVIGRLRVGQRATMRLDGFPWARFGVVDCVVAQVAADSSASGSARVELDLTSPEHPTIPLQHGLGGTIEVAIDRLTPFRLLSVELGGAARGEGAPR